MFTSGTARTPRSPLRSIRLHVRRMVVVPAVTAIEPVAPGHARVRVDGMVCAACAVRTEAAFRRVAGVRSARADLDAGVLELRHDPAHAPAPADLRRALDAVVVAMPVRRLLARLARGCTSRSRAAG